MWLNRVRQSVVRSGLRSGLRLAVAGPLCLSPVLAVGALAIVPAAAAHGQQKFPEPSVYPLTPELDFKNNMPKRIVVDVPGDPYPKAYWYMTYTVTNKNDKAVHFMPSFELLAEDGKLHRSDKAIPPQVFDAIKKREGNKLLEPARQIESDVQPGEDQARDGVAIWPEPMQRMGTFSVFVGGLNDEYVTLRRDGADFVPAKPNDVIEFEKANAGKSEEDREKERAKTFVTLRKTLHLTFHVFGDEIRPGTDEVHTKGRKWVMR